MSDDLEQQRRDIEALKAELNNLRQLQDELRETKERWQIVLKANNDGIWDWNIQTNKLFFSPRWKEMLGYEEEDLPNQHGTWVNLLHEEDRSYATEFLQAYLERRVSSYRLEFRLRCKNGGYKWILSRGKAVWDENGDPIRFAGSHTDISERKHRESMLKNLAKREHTLSEIARQLIDQDFEIVIQSILQTIGEFTGSEQGYIIHFSEDQQEWSMLYEWCNPQNTQITSRLEHYQNQSINLFPWLAEQLLSGQSIKINSMENLPSVAVREKEVFGNSLTPHLLIVPMTNSKKIVAYLGLEANSAKHWTIEDVNWLKLVGEFIAIAQARSEAEKALKTAKESADKANHAKSEFLANMSHELRTPLNAILGFTQVMNRDPSLNREQRENLQIINRSGEHLLVLINDILEMSKIEAGRMTYHPNSFDLYALLDTLQDMFSLKAKAKRLQFVFYRSPEVPRYLYTDEGKLRQILINLLSNAIKFTETGGVTLRVKTEEVREINQDIRLFFEVEDTGIGIDPNDEDKLFEAFGQTQGGLNSQEGTGLGLSISQKFLQLWQGQIQFQSILGQGSIFRFEIVAKIIDGENININAPVRQVICLAPNQPVYRILVVDDRSESRLFLDKLLSSVGFLVKQAGNGKEAIALWQDWQPHLIFMDLKMPVMDGYEAIQQIKKTPKGQKTVIIALTASAFQEDFKDHYLFKYDDFMQKPFREELLWEKIAHYLGVIYLDGGEKFKITELNENLAISQLKFMSSEWVQKLKTAAQECNDDRLLELIEEIPVKDAELSKLLKKLAHDFLFETILDLIDDQK